MKINSNIKKNAVCNTCTLKLVSIAYKRKPDFRFFREPLKIGMKIFSCLYCINPNEYLVKTPACHGCIRFYKVALKEKSSLFRWLNNKINPIFDRVIESIVTKEELSKSKGYGKLTISGKVSIEESDEWMKDLKTGF